MLGKQKCKILKEIRQKIADENDIPYVTRECTHQGACKGTCPKCESELRYLEQQLQLRQSLGKRVAVVALCTSLAMGGAGCTPIEALQDVFGTRTEDIAGMIENVTPSPEPMPEPLEGETTLNPDDPELLPGEEPCPDGGEDEWELEGDVLYVPEDPAENGHD